MRTIRRLAIVNRGEPAMRALAAVAELNEAGDAPPISTIVVHTDPDAQAWYVREADEGLSLGPATYVDPADGRRPGARWRVSPGSVRAGPGGVGDGASGRRAGSDAGRHPQEDHRGG